MLAIRMQRTGRKGHAMFRVVVQDSRRTPTSGRVVAQLGSYDPHAKSIIVDKEKANFYLSHGAQPSDRVARLLKSEGVTLPSWVILPTDKQRVVRHADKRRSTTPAVETPVVEETTEDVATETEVETPAEVETAADATEETTESPDKTAEPQAKTE
jgi:small subunit ribosomal protein S16